MNNTSKIAQKHPWGEVYPFHWLLISLFALLSLWANNFSQVPTFAILRSLILVLILSFLFFAASLLIWRSLLKAGFFASLLALLFFSFGHIYNLLNQVREIHYRYLLLVYLVLLVGGIIGIRRIKKPQYRFNLLLNGIGLVLVILPGAQLAEGATQGSLELPEAPPATQFLTINHPSTPQPGRDVYYILLDMYSREDTLKNDYQLDNSSFISSLENLGFIVDPCAQSNYDQTHSSMSATLNMNYLDNLGIPMYPDAEDVNMEDFTERIQNNQVRSIFRALGYQYVTFKSIFPWIDTPDSDIYIDPQGGTQLLSSPESLTFQYLLLETTLVKPVLLEMNSPAFQSKGVEPIFFNLINPKSDLFSSRNYEYYKIDQAAFNAFSQVQQIPGKKLVYAHLLPTHVPFVYNPDGSFNNNHKEDSEGYIPAVQYTNTRILSIVASLIKNAKTPPIIILQGDHGFPTDATRVRILNALYLPDGGAAKHYNGMTPVNTFRFILNTYFGQSYRLLPDQSFHTPYQTPSRAYQFDPVPPSCANRPAPER